MGPIVEHAGLVGQRMQRTGPHHRRDAGARAGAPATASGVVGHVPAQQFPPERRGVRELDGHLLRPLRLSPRHPNAFLRPPTEH